MSNEFRYIYLTIYSLVLWYLKVWSSQWYYLNYSCLEFIYNLFVIISFFTSNLFQHFEILFLVKSGILHVEWASFLISDDLTHIQYIETFLMTIHMHLLTFHRVKTKRSADTDTKSIILNLYNTQQELTVCIFARCPTRVRSARISAVELRRR